MEVSCRYRFLRAVLEESHCEGCTRTVGLDNTLNMGNMVVETSTRRKFIDILLLQTKCYICEHEHVNFRDIAITSSWQFKKILSINFALINGFQTSP
jgi:hypothetical protein